MVVTPEIEAVADAPEANEASWDIEAIIDRATTQVTVMADNEKQEHAHAPEIEAVAPEAEAVAPEPKNLETKQPTVQNRTEQKLKPRKKNQPLNYDEAILLLKFFSLNDPISFKSYCDTHVEALGEQGSDKRLQMQNHYSTWKKKGEMPSKYNNPSKYPEELVQTVSLKLSLMVERKATQAARDVKRERNREAAEKKKKEIAARKERNREAAEKKKKEIAARKERNREAAEKKKKEIVAKQPSKPTMKDATITTNEGHVPRPVQTGGGGRESRSSATNTAAKTPSSSSSTSVNVATGTATPPPPPPTTTTTATMANTKSVEGKVNGNWQQYEDEYIVSMVNRIGFGKWKEISESGLPHRLPNHIRARFIDHLDPQRKPKWTPWTDREDQILLEHQQKNGNKWAAISKKLQGRSQTDIKNRFHNTLKKWPAGIAATNNVPGIKRPNKKRVPWTDREDQILLEHQQKNGNKWAAISKKLQGRSQGDIKNRFHNTLLKKALQGATATLPCETKTTNTAGIATATAAIAATNDVIGSKKRKNTNSCAHEGSNDALTNMEQAIQTTTTTAASTMPGIQRPNKKRVRARTTKANGGTTTMTTKENEKETSPESIVEAEPDSFVLPPIPTSSILEFQSWITKRKRSWRTKREVALVEQEKQENGKYFVDHFAAKFVPKEEENNTIVQVIPESHPEAIIKASVNNATMSLNIAPAEHDHNFRQVGGTLPVTEEVRQAFTTGLAICTVTTLDNYYNGINPANFHTRRKVSRHLPPNLAGGIHKWGLVPLQSKLKSSEQENVWMGGVHSLDWMAGHVIKDHPELLQGDHILVCIVIPSGDQRLDLFHQFRGQSPYTDYVKPVISPFIVPVFAKDTVEFPANLIPHFLANAPHHPTVVPLLTEEQKLERSRAYQRSYAQQHREQQRVYDRSRREHKRAWQRSYSQSEARRCTFSNEHCNKIQQSGCNKMCKAHYYQSLK